MRINADRIRGLCEQRGLRLGELLGKAGVSRTAFYSLARKDSVLPASIVRVAETLNVCPGDILVDEKSLRDQAVALAEQARRISAQKKGVNPENVRHTLILLQYDPLERLRRALTRAA